jgi:LuxR family maltose regulon positive regulatory protein
MTDIVLQTKLVSPRLRPNLVHRDHLVKRLAEHLFQDQGFTRRLTLVSASAGYGKTTLVAEWLGSTQLKAAWLSLDEGDNDPVVFLTYMVSAIQQVRADFGKSLVGMLRSPQPVPSQGVLAAFLNELAALPELISLVLDDYHVIRTLRIHEALEFILDHQPAQFHLVILTRQDPLLPVARLRASGQVVEIRQDDLRFNPEEVSAFMRDTMGLRITPDEVAILEKRTEGWAAGLQLAALSLREQKDRGNFLALFSGSSRFVLDYLLEEVFNTQSAEVQEFLLKTSILDRLSGPVCDAVVERANSQNLLTALEHNHLFVVPLDQAGTWYRYHQLFRELLSHRLKTNSELDEKQLHKLASAWYQGAGLILQAIPHALSAQDWPQAAALIGRMSNELLRRGELVRLVEWCQSLPAPVLEHSIELALGYAWALLLSGQYDRVDPFLAQMERSAQNQPSLLGMVYAAQAYLARGQGNQEQVIEKSRLALDLLPESELASRLTLTLNLGLVYWHQGHLSEAEGPLQQTQDLARRTENYYALTTAQVFLVRVLAARGRLRQAEQQLRPIAAQNPGNPGLALVYLDLSSIYYEWNQLEQAEAFLEQGLQVSLQSGNTEFQNSGYLQRALLRQAKGDVEGALADAGISHELVRTQNQATQSRSAACQAYLALKRGDLPAAARWNQLITLDADPRSFYRFFNLVTPYFWIAQGKLAEARLALDKTYARAASLGCGYAGIAVRVLQSLAAREAAHAQGYLQAALKQAQPEGLIRTFVDAGAALIPLLEQAAQEGCTPGYVGQILAAFKTPAAPVQKASAALVEPLSERELEVLRLAAAGLSNHEIAGRLYISPGTVKTHLHNLCGKLGVRNRTEAAMRANELQLI